MYEGEVYSNRKGIYSVKDIKQGGRVVIEYRNGTLEDIDRIYVYQSFKRGDDIECGVIKQNMLGQNMTIEEHDDAEVTVRFDNGKSYVLSYYEWYKGCISDTGEFIDRRKLRGRDNLKVLKEYDDGMVDMLDTKTKLVAIHVSKDMSNNDFMKSDLMSKSLYIKQSNTEQVAEVSKGTLNPDLSATDSKRYSKFKRSADGVLMGCISIDSAQYCTVYFPELGVVRHRVFITKFNTGTYNTVKTASTSEEDADEFFQRMNTPACTVVDDVDTFDSFEKGIATRNKDNELMIIVGMNDDEETCDIYFPEYDVVNTGIKRVSFLSKRVSPLGKGTISATDYGVSFNGGRDSNSLGWSAYHKGRLGCIKVGFNKQPMKIIEYISPSNLSVQYKNGKTVRNIDYYYYMYGEVIPDEPFIGLSGLSKSAELDSPRLMLDSSIRCQLRGVGIKSVKDIVEKDLRDIVLEPKVKMRIACLKEVLTSNDFEWGC